MKKGLKVVVIIILLVLLGVGVLVLPKYFSKSEIIEENIATNELENENQVVLDDVDEVEVVETEPEINIFKGDERPIAFMIDNNVNAQPQASLNSAYMVYEIIVEGNESRLMALFKGVDADEVGPIRSSRHYFLNYAMENDAIYAHLGWSPFAQADIAEYGINNINGQAYDTGKARTSTSLYWRASHKNAPHNAYTNIDSILKICNQKGYRTTSDKESVLNYSAEEVKLETEDAVIANTITIPYASSHKVKYVYNEDEGRYTRYSKGKLMKDETTSEEITTKNIIITFAENYNIQDTENKGRQEVETVGELNGYYITNGKAIKIKCVKESREAQTKYLDLEGNEIKVNDGNTWVNICPIDANVTIEE